MSKIDIRVFNFLVHYGPKDQKNLLDLMEECLWGLLLQGPVLEGRNSAYVENVTPVSGRDTLISGYFYRSSLLQWDFIKKGDLAKLAPGEQEVMPRARFIIDLLNHRLFWITERGKTHKPHHLNFVAYSKKLCLSYLQTKYAKIAADEYAEEKPEKKTRFQYIRERFLEEHVTSATFKMELVPLLETDSLKIYLEGDRYRIDKLKIVPHINNPTNEDFADLFENTGKFASKARAKAAVTLKPAVKGESLNKEVVKEVVEENETKQLLDLEMDIKDTHNEEAAPIKVSNNPKVAATDISLKYSVELSIDAQGVVGKIEQFMSTRAARDLGQEVIDKIKRRIKSLFE